tara:strand:- start:7030 stop:7617 length:588 start_codon:yes stop_codon:yes gene_type:complete
MFLTLILYPKIASPDTDVVVMDENSLKDAGLENTVLNDRPVSKLPKEKNQGIEKTLGVPDKSELKGIVIGKNLTVGMTLEEAIRILGVPKSFGVERGAEPEQDRVTAEYAGQGIIIYALNDKKEIESLDVLKEFKGEFLNGVKMGEKIKVLIKKWGLPHSMNSSIVHYPTKGIYFDIKDNVLISAHVFHSNKIKK